MKLKSFFATCCIAGLTTVAAAPDTEFTHYIGSFPTGSPIPVPLAGDAAGKLYYATFQANRSQLWIVDNPVAAIDSATTPGKHVRTFTEMVTAGRGFQGLQVTTDGKIFLSGDNAGAPGLMFRLDPVVVGSETTYTEVATFRTNSELNGARKLGMALISEAGAGLLAVNSLTDIRYHDFTGLQVGSPVALPKGNNREVVYNSTDSVLYPLRNGVATSVTMEAIVTGVNTATGGGTVVTGKTLPGADGGANGVPNSHGYYYAAQHQLITVGQTHLLSGGTTEPATIRVWDISENGTTMSLAYEVDKAHGNAGWTEARDAVVIGNRLYVSSGSPESRIYVYEAVPAAVSRWNDYEDTK